MKDQGVENGIEHIHNCNMLQLRRVRIYGLIVFLQLLLAFHSHAAIYFARQSGNWNSTSTWSTAGYGGAAAASTPGSVPGDVVLLSGITVTVTATPANSITSITISQNYNSGNTTKLYLSTAGTTLTCNSLSMIENNRADNVQIDVSYGTLQVNGSVSITRSTTNSQNELLQLYIRNNGRMNITGSLTWTYGRAANNGDNGCEVLLEDNGRLDVTNNFTVAVGNANGNDSEFRFQMNDNTVCNIGGNVSLTLSNSSDGDDLVMDLNGGTLSVTGTYSATVANTCTSSNSCNLYIDGATMSTSAFTYTQSGGGNGDMSIFLNRSNTSTAALLTVNGAITFTHNDGDNMEIETNSNSTLTVVGAINSTISSSSDGDILYYDFNGGTVNTSSMSTVVASGATNANHFQFTVDGTTVNVTNNVYIAQNGGGSGDAYVYMNQNSTSTAAAFNVGGNFVFTHTGGDNMEIETNTNSTMTISGNLTDTLTSNDGDNFYIDINGGTLTVNGNYTHYISGGGISEDLDIRIDGTGRFVVGGNVTIPQTSGDDVIIYLNNSSGSAAQFNIGANFICTHTGGDDFYIYLGGTSSVLSVGGYFTNTFTSSDGDQYTLDLDGGSVAVTGYFSYTQNGGGTSEDITMTLDGASSFTVGGAMTINQQSGDDGFLYLNNSSGTTAQMTVGGDFTFSHTGGDDFTMRLGASSSALAITGNFNNTWTSSDGDNFLVDINGGAVTVGGNTTFNETASGGTTEELYIYIDGAGRFATTGSFTLTHAAGDDAFIYLNNSNGTNAQFTVGANLSVTHTNGDDVTFLLNGSASVFTVGNNFSETWTSSDGDNHLIDINGGTLSVGGNYTWNQTASGGTTEECYIYIDAAGKMTTAGSFTVTHAAGDDVLIYLNNSTGTTAQFTVGTDMTVTHTNGDDFTILMNGASNVFSIGGNFSETWTSSDGDNHLIDINGGTLSVGGNYTWNQTATGGTTEEFYIYIDGAGKMTTTGTFTVTHAAGDDILIYLNNSTGTTAQFTVGSTMTVTHTNGDDFYLMLNGSSNVVTIGGNFTNTWTSSDGDQNTIDVNGGVLTVGGSYSYTQTATGSTTENLSVLIDGTGQFNTTGSFTVSQQTGNDIYIYLNNASGSAAQFTVGGDLTVTHGAGDDFIFQLNGAGSVATITGSFNTTWTSNDGDLYYIDINGGTLTVGQNVSINETASGGTTEDITVRIDGAGKYIVGGSYTTTQAAGNDVTIFLNNAGGTTAQFTVTGDFIYTHTGGDDFMLQLNGSATASVGNFTTSFTSADGDLFDIDINGGTLTATGAYTYTQPAPGGTTESANIRIDGTGIMNVTGAFTINQQAGDDNGIFLNAAAGTTSQLNIGGTFTLNHTGGDDFELETNGVSSQVNITGSFNTTWTSSDGDLYYLDLNDGLLGVGGSYSVNQTASGGTTEDITIRLDAAARMNVTGSCTFTQAAGNDVTIMLNSTAGTTAQFNVGGTFTETHSGGDDFELELNGSSTATIGGDMITSWTSSDGDDYFIDVNGGILTVTGNYTYTQPAPGGTTEDCDIRIDGSGRFNVTGATSITQNSGGNVILYLNNLAGTTSQFNNTGNFTITHGTAATGVFLEANQSSVFTVGGSFQIDNAAAGGDLARFRLNNTPTVTITGNYTMNNTAGSTAVTDNVELDINGGAMTVGGTLTMNESGGNDAILTLDGTCSLAVAGTLSIQHTGGDDNYVTLGASSGSPTVTAGALILNDGGGDITYCRLYNSSIMTVGGNVTLTAAAATQVDIGVYSTSQFKIGGNFVRAASPSRYGVLSSAATATVEYNGGSLQTIAGDGGSGGDAFTYGNVRLNNGAGFQMTATEGVATIPNTSTLNFSSGIVSSISSAYFIIAAGGAVSNASNTSYVDGPIRKVGNTAFTFPVGDNNNYQPISISAPSNAAHHFTAQYVAADPNSPYTVTSKDASLNHVSRCEYWLLDRTGGASNVTATLSWDAGSCGVDDMPALRVAQWDGTAWRDRGNASTTGANAAGTITSNSLTSFATPSPITLTSNNAYNPLPVELIKFDVKPEDERAKLLWATASEKDNDYFEVERSDDGVHYSAIGQVRGAGNSSAILTYTWYDLKPLRGLSYYRLKQVDINGDFEYSDVRTCLFNVKQSGKSFTLYPNPNSGSKIYISFNTEQQNKTLSIDIFDVNGVSVFSDLTVDTDASGKNAMLSIPKNLAKGVYVVSLHNTENSEKQLLVIN